MGGAMIQIGVVNSDYQAEITGGSLSWIHDKEGAMRTYVYILSSIFLCILALQSILHHHYLKMVALLLRYL